MWRGKIFINRTKFVNVANLSLFWNKSFSRRQEKIRLPKVGMGLRAAFGSQKVKATSKWD